MDPFACGKHIFYVIDLKLLAFIQKHKRLKKELYFIGRKGHLFYIIVEEKAQKQGSLSVLTLQINYFIYHQGLLVTGHYMKAELVQKVFINANIKGISQFASLHLFYQFC